MRIKDHEYKDIVSALEQGGFRIQDFDFVKKKGWFHLISKEKDKFFSFHRKLETELQDGNFVDSLTYRYKSESESGETSTWENTRELLIAWLQSLGK